MPKGKKKNNAKVVVSDEATTEVVIEEKAEDVVEESVATVKTGIVTKTNSNRKSKYSVKNNTAITQVIAGITILAGSEADVSKDRFDAYSRSSFGHTLINNKSIVAS